MNIILHCNHRTRTKFDWFWRTLWWEQAKFIEEIICFIPPGFSPPIYCFCGVGSPWFIIYVGRFTMIYYFYEYSLHLFFPLWVYSVPVRSGCPGLCTTQEIKVPTRATSGSSHGAKFLPPHRDTRGCSTTPLLPPMYQPQRIQTLNWIVFESDRVTHILIFLFWTRGVCSINFQASLQAGRHRTAARSSSKACLRVLSLPPTTMSTSHGHGVRANTCSESPIIALAAAACVHVNYGTRLWGPCLRRCGLRAALSSDQVKS